MFVDSEHVGDKEQSLIIYRVLRVTTKCSTTWPSTLAASSRVYTVHYRRGPRNFWRNSSSQGPWSLSLRPGWGELGATEQGSWVGLLTDNSWGGHCRVSSSHILSTSVPWQLTGFTKLAVQWLLLQRVCVL